MQESVYLIIPVSIVLLIFKFQIKQIVERKYPESHLPINLMEMAVTITLILVGSISAVSSGILPVASFYIVLPILGIFFVCYGITHRNEVAQKMRRAYYNALIGYSYLFAASGVAMFWLLPFMPKIVL